MPALLGADDDLGGLRAAAPGARRGLAAPPALAARAAPAWSWSRWCPAIIEQKVTGQEAFARFRALVHRYGERAPGPGGELRLWVQPGAETLRGDPVLGVAADAHRPGPVPHGRHGPRGSPTPSSAPSAPPHDEADRRLRTLPGIGVWTSAEVRVSGRIGDPDAVSFGDYHVAKDVGWALTGTPVRRRASSRSSCEPWRPHRGRVQALVGIMAAAPPPARPADVAAHAPAGELTRPGSQSSGRSGPSTASVNRR